MRVLSYDLTYTENLIIYAMEVIEPNDHHKGICVVSTGEYGVHFIDCETLENYYTFKV